MELFNLTRTSQTQRKVPVTGTGNTDNWVLFFVETPSESSREHFGTAVCFFSPSTR